MLLEKTHKHQSDLSRFCRSGDYIPIEGVNEKHIGQYRRLVFNNVIDSISNAYPLTNDLLGDEAFEKLVNRFFNSHDIQNPQIWYMPVEFKDYILKNEIELISEYPFLNNLLEFEWLEVEVFMMPDIPFELDKGFDKYYVNPEIRLMRFDFPVHLLNSKEIKIEHKGNYFMAMHRNRESGAVHFTNLSVPFVYVLEQLLQNPMSESDIKNIIEKYADKKQAEKAFEKFIEKSVTNQLIYKL